MKLLKLNSLALAIFATTSFMQAQTVEEIIGRTVLATGGKEAIEKINSIYSESTTQVMGNEMSTQTYILNGKGYKNESDMGGQKIIQCYSDKGGWMINPMNGGSPESLPANQLKSAKLQFEIGGPFYNYESKGNKFELVGKEMVGQVKAFKLKLLTKDSVEINYFIDPSTYYIIRTQQKTEMMGQEMTMITSLSDYRKTDIGYVMPFAMDLNFGDQFSLNIVVKKVEFNKPVDPAIFELPK